MNRKESVNKALVSIYQALSGPIQNVGTIADLLELSLDNPDQLQKLVGVLKRESEKLMDITVDIHNQMI